MQYFEIHITGESGINSELDKLDIKNIIVDLLYPTQDFFRREYMSSFVKKFSNYQECLSWVKELVTQIKTPIIRIKIESPYYTEYEDISLYMESHFTPRPGQTKYPISQNYKSGRLMATDREYDKKKYFEFRQKWGHEDIELCLYDTFITEDKDWFNLYESTDRES